MNEDDLAWAKKTLDQLSEAASGITQRLVQSCRDGDGQAAAMITAQLRTQPDSLLVLVLGSLTTRLVNAEQRASQAHGPMVKPEDMGIGPEDLIPAPWQQAVADQLQTAAAHNDYRTYARMGVDNQLKSIAVDKETGHEYDWEALFRGLLLVDHQTLIVLATEMLYRLSGNTP
jgi:hypothetical protein